MPLCPPSKPAFEGVSEGTHVAVCSMIVDLGMQDGPYGLKHQICIQFEVPGERVKYTDDSGVEREGPRTIGKFYNFTLAENSTLRKDLESWRGKSFQDSELMDPAGNPIFDISTVVARPCQLSVIKNEHGRSKIASIIGLPKGFPVPPLEGEAIIYDSDHPQNLSKLSEGMRKIIDAQQTQSVKVPEDSMGHANQDIPFDDDVPF